MSHDPKLKACMAEIVKVMNRYEVGGYVSLISKTHGEFEFKLPGWIGIFWLKDGRGFRLKLKGKEHDKAELTGHFCFSLRDTLGHAYLAMDKMCQVFENSVGEVDHKPLHEFETEDRPT